ncbi:Shoulder domain protein [Enhygromyxa salina]|uniref:Shoulder domain protein n=2 Tax=Enhygromyxa salina TaxID=215803 RepID=A0A2S9XPX0_9BACT|nr:Shoulder domain protein [Enhygromyxa salina]
MLGAAMNDRARERDLILAPNEYAFIADETKGNINAYIGPYKTSLANTDQPVVFNPESKRFERCSLEAATRAFAVAPAGWYLVLKNPAKDGTHPKTGAINNLIELEIGRKVNRPGPAAFALWPGQMVRTIQGHNLRSNQYLIVRVYDEEAAKANWKNAVIKPKAAGGEEASAAEVPSAAELTPDLTMGQQLVIKGTDVSFYIPSTGIEVVPDESGEYVRDAVTLERLEYCILLDEDGNKSYLQGPAVVFPSPTETFVERGGANKYRAIELNENSGIYVKVIAPYRDDPKGDQPGVSHDVGDELFITGKDQMIYFPRPEHAAIKYGDHTISYAVAIPAGEARYVLDRNTGHIRLERGPSIFLPDPRREVIVRRILDPRHVQLWFPGNEEALAHNRRLAAVQGGKRDFVEDAELEESSSTKKGKRRKEVSDEYAGDDFNRGQTYTPPRTITLDTRYDGAVSVGVWTGYAVLVVSKTGERKVIVGPSTYMLEYDEVLQAAELSTGTPKSDDRLARTVYLRVLYNKVSDVVEAETADLVQVRVRLSYRVNFEGDPQHWFNVENYVKFLTEHLRSLLRAAIKQRTVQSFHPQVARDVRDVVLGPQGEDGKRPGRRFEENGMRIYDVEVLDVEIGDDAIEKLLIEAQHAVVEQTLTLEGDRRRLEQTRERETIKQEIDAIEATTKQKRLGLQRSEVEALHGFDLAKIEAELDSRKRRLEAERAEQESVDAVHDAKLARDRRSSTLDLETSDKQLAMRLRELEAEVKAVADKAQAISPDLIAALQAFGDQALAEKMAQSMAPLAILGGESVAEVLARLLQGTKLARVLEVVANEE